MKPLVSIIIPCYNAEEYVQACVESALNQNYDRVEVLAIDNESSDSTLNILEDLQKSYDNLFIDTAPNIYPNCWDEARQKGFELSSGKYLFTLASDDFLDRSYISNCMEYVQVAPEKIMVLQSPIKNVEGNNTIPRGEIKHTYRNLEMFKEMCLEKCPANSPTVMFNRSLYEKGLLKTYPEKYGGAADYDLYCRLANNGIFIYPAHRWTGYYYRWHEKQATWNVHKEGINYDKKIQEYWREKWQD